MMQARQTLFIAAMIVVVAGLGVWLGVPHLQRAAERAMVYVPTEADVIRSFPEARLPRSSFAGIWAERDRGTWIFEYRDANTSEARDLLKNTLLAAGWLQRSTRDSAASEDHFRKPAIGAHLLIREQPSGLRILIILSAEDDLAEDPFSRRVLRDRWRAAP